jgi:tetratricopeptide (TPR) repeat protein
MLLASGAPVMMVVEEESPVEFPGSSVLDLAPMSEREQLALMDALVPLDPLVRAQLAELCGDHPGLLIQTLTELVVGDAFQRGDDGWRLRSDARFGLPEDVLAEWTDRVAQALDAMAPSTRSALQAAACLGRALGEGTFRAVCEGAGSSPEQVAAGSAGLVRAVGASARFEHPAVTWLLRQQADVASMRVAIRAVETIPGAEATHAELVVRSGQLEGAAEPLRRGAVACLAAGDTVRALEFLDRRAASLGRVDAADAPVDLADAWLRALLAHQSGGDDAEARAEVAVAFAEREGDPTSLGEALLVKAREAWKRGRWEPAQAALQRAVDAFGRVGDLQGIGRALRESGEVSCSVGDLTSALTLHTRAVERLAAGDPASRAAVRVALAETWRQWGELAKAEQQVTAALAEVGDGPSAIRAEILSVRGDIARTAGRLEDAEAGYREALTALPWQSARRVRELRLRRACLRIAAGRFEEARALAERLLLTSGSVGGPFVGRCALVALVARALADERTWAASLELAKPWMATCDRDVGWLLDVGGRRTAAGGHRGRAVLFFQAAAEVYGKMGLVFDQMSVERRAASVRAAR